MSCNCGDRGCDLVQHPSTRRSVVPYACVYCGSEFRSAWLAATCCDPISNDIETV